MKKWITLLLALVMVLSLCACGGKTTAEQQLIADSVGNKIKSDDFNEWQNLYKEFTGNTPKSPEVTAVVHYELEDFEGEKMDCYLVNVAADVAWWTNKEAQQGSTDTQFQLFVSSDGKMVLDSITTDAIGFNGDTSTAEGRATYLLWIFGGMDGSHEGNFVNGSEKVQEMTAADLSVINANIQ